MFDAPTEREPNESVPLPRLPRSPAPAFPPRERERIEQRLRAQRTELIAGIARREANPAPQASEDPSSLAILQGELAKTTHALARLAAGTYGTCERCGGPISLSRLRVIPSATHCEQCSAPSSTAHDPVH